MKAIYLWWVWRSWLARQIVALEAGGSSPLTHPIAFIPRAIFINLSIAQKSKMLIINPAVFNGPVAQLAEQGTLNPKVQGSNPCRSTIHFLINPLLNFKLILLEYFACDIQNIIDSYFCSVFQNNFAFDFINLFDSA
jgi:hypothetical protein